MPKKKNMPEEDIRELAAVSVAIFSLFGDLYEAAGDVRINLDSTSALRMAKTLASLSARASEASLALLRLEESVAKKGGE